MMHTLLFVALAMLWPRTGSTRGSVGTTKSFASRLGNVW
jgi:hypothetical protein